MTRRARVSKLEGQKVRRGDPVRVVITRQIVGHGAEGPEVLRTVRRVFDLYPEGVPTVGGRWPK